MGLEIRIHPKRMDPDPGGEVPENNMIVFPDDWIDGREMLANIC